MLICLQQADLQATVSTYDWGRAPNAVKLAGSIADPHLVSQHERSMPGRTWCS